MIIVIDALLSCYGGGKTYLLELLRHTDRSWFLANRVKLLVAGENARYFEDFDIEIVSCRLGSAKWMRLLNYLYWSIFKIPKLLRRWNADIFFCPGGYFLRSVPLNCKKILTFQNTLPFSRERKGYGLGYMRMRLEMLKYFLINSIKSADLVIFISQYARKTMAELTAGNIRAQVVIPHGINPVFMGDQIIHRNQQFGAGDWELPRCVIAAKAGIQNRGYFLYVSILDVYKNQIEVLRAFYLLQRLRLTPEKLILAGPEYPPYGAKVKREIVGLKLQKDVILTGPVAPDALPELYKQAKAVIFASSCETCSIALLEALACARPLFCSKAMPMPEFAQDAAFYFDPKSPWDLARLMSVNVDKPAMLQEKQQRARQLASGYSWQQSAAKTWKAMAAMLGSLSETAQ